MMLQPQYDIWFTDMLLSPKCDLFRGTDGDVYVWVDTPNGKTTLPLDSQEGDARVTEMFERENKGVIITPAEKKRASVLAYGRILDKPAREVFLRVGHDGEAYYLDLHTQPKTYVRFNAKGWVLTDKVPVHFREGQGQLPMQLPVGVSDDNAGFKTLRSLLTINDLQWHCLLPLLVSYMLPDIQRPILLLTGEQNSGKSTFVEIVKTLVDPNSAAIGGDVPDPRNFFIKVSSTWVSTFDNLSGLDGKQQDAICQAATGGSFQTRRLWTDRGLVTITIKNPIILAGISNVAGRGDIASRAVLFELQSIDRQDKLISAESITRRLLDAGPSILRALLNLAVAVLKLQPKIEAPPNVRPAAYGKIGLAVEQAMGWYPGTFEKSYHFTRQSLHDDVLDNYIVISALMQHLESKKSAGEYSEHPDVLLSMLKAKDSDESRAMPKNAAVFTKVLKDCAPAIRKQYGWDAQSGRTNQGRKWTFTYTPPVPMTAPVPASKATPPEVLAVAAKLKPKHKESLGQSVKRITTKKGTHVHKEKK